MCKVSRYFSIQNGTAQSTLAVEHADFISAEGRDSSTSILDLTPSKNDGEVPLMPKHWEMRSALSLHSLTGTLGPEVVAPDRVLSMGQIELFDHLNCVQTNDMSNGLVKKKQSDHFFCVRK